MNFEKRKEQILKVAFELFARNGFKKTTTKIIAQKAGISEALLYKHFSSKKELYNSIREYTEKLISKSINSINLSYENINNIDDLKKILKLFILKFINIVKNNPNLIRITMYAKLEDPDFASIMIHPEEFKDSILHKIFKLAINRGVIKNINPKILSKYFFGTFNVLIDKKSSDEKIKAKDIKNNLDNKIEIFFDLLFNGIKK